MSRSRPTTSEKNPASRWFEWSGQDGTLYYYDKEAKAKVTVDLPITFLALDRMAAVGGWHDESQSGIYSNAVHSTQKDPLVVKAFKSNGTLAEGFYADIKDKVKRVGGHYVSICYVGYKDADGQLVLGAVKFKGAALRSWMDFSKEAGDKLFQDAFTIDGYDEGKKGSITFRVPTFTLASVSEATDAAAAKLDAQLQAYLDVYLAKARTADVVDGHDQRMYPEPEEDLEPLTDDDIPF